MVETRRHVDEKGRYTLVFLAAPDDEAAGRADKAPLVELTYNWDPEVYTGGRNFGHLAYEVDDIYAALREAAGGRRGDQPAAARRAHGVRPLARQYFHRAVAEGRRAAARRAVEVDAEHGGLVRSPRASRERFERDAFDLRERRRADGEVQRVP